MNVTEIARRLAIPTRDLKELLPQFGFGIGRRAIKVDKRIAERILKQGALIRKAWEDKQRAAREAEKIVIPESVPKEIVIAPGTTVKEFALMLHVPVTKLLAELMKNGIIATLNNRLDPETATIIAADLGRTILFAEKKEKDGQGEEAITRLSTEEQKLSTVVRPPVVVIMGHVDHGKTRLLDTIRKTNVLAGEAGGITQHIGAYQVEKNDRKITFIDTPGHEAFTTMRSRGARIADIAILVVAADDGVQPQTKEAVKIIRGSGIPFVVALNKIDKPEANPEKTKKELSEIEIIPEEWGGKTTIVPISAKTGDGVSQLLDMVLLTADFQKEKRKTDPVRPAVATVIESHVDPGSGPRATVLVQLGTLRRGDIVGIRGIAYGKVRALRDWNDAEVTDAPPGMPVVLLGLKAAPGVGDILEVSDDPGALQKFRGSRKREKTTSIDRKKKEAHVGHVPLLLRADVVGSLEAITLSLEKLSAADASVSLVSKGLGQITENDVLHAEASGALIVGFHVGPTPAARELAREKEVVIREYTVIYDLLNEVKKALERELAPEDIIVELGTLQVLARFREEQQWVIVGGKVLDGEIVPKATIRVSRKGTQIGEGFVTEIRVGKEIVTTVKKGEEAGLKITGITDIQPHDVLQAFRKEQRKRTLEA